MQGWRAPGRASGRGVASYMPPPPTVAGAKTGTPATKAGTPATKVGTPATKAGQSTSNEVVAVMDSALCRTPLQRQGKVYY